MTTARSLRLLSLCANLALGTATMPAAARSIASKARAAQELPAGLPKPANLPLQQHQFEDGTATIGLAEGWTTPTREAMHGVVVNGPEHQLMTIGAAVSVQAPGSIGAGAPGTLTAELGTPLEVLRSLVPQLSELSAKNGGPRTAIDEITPLATLKASLPNGQAQLLRCGISERASDGSEVHYQALAQVEVTPFGNGAFMMSLTAMRAPDANFERGLPVMLQMLQSLRLNDAEIERRAAHGPGYRNDWSPERPASDEVREAARGAQRKPAWQNHQNDGEKAKGWEAGESNYLRPDGAYSPQSSPGR